MTTTSISLTASPEEATTIVAALETAFADDGYPIDEVRLDEGKRRRVEILFWDKTPEEAAMAVRDELPADIAGRIVASRLGDEDWVAKSLEGLAPVWAARIVVHGRHDRGRIPATAMAIEIEAAQAFGTGHHGTTVGCLLALQRLVRRGAPRRMLDLGTGTGVLAIALAKLTRRSVLATDIDPVATRTAELNAWHNGVGPLVRCITADGAGRPSVARQGPYDLIVANILARPLQNMAGDVSGIADERATLVLSGLRRVDRARILSAYRRQGFHLERADIIDDWLTLTLIR